MHIKTLSISQLNNYIKKVLDNDFILKNASIKGEISNFKIHTSGHIYFSLKDEYSKINCIMFKSYAKDIKFNPQNGNSVIARGRVSLYLKDGLYQFYCEEMQQEGKGDLFAAFENLKDKLKKEHIFEEAHKKVIPRYAKKIGVVTSPTGAALRDIINVTKRRNSSVEMLIYPALVQGETASAQIINGIKYFDSREDIDAIILARGGGSIEELWAFNNEKLAYTIYNCNKPIITGVGHETDFTIADFASDKRAPTPSAAAEIAVFNLNELNSKIQNYKELMYNKIQSNVNERYSYLNLLSKNLKIYSPMINIANQYTKIDNMKQILIHKIQLKINKEKECLVKMNSLLSAHNPLNVLNKGFSIIQDSEGNIVSSTEKLKQQCSIEITFKDGKVKTDICNCD
ncbi:exodeoxyribonuclease VII large subunit [Clostridium aestuarii]|uniref:Exodeoxyribonuclease 7 large subunit n=1 Tax=Clostridium aestuarii TaxID=338193 RepID=A0ABT4D0R1_9CLOT|nr:exodeoxyribonuclease VII large subunit [Clostridium aestuarii]MCY6483760.1 exodeoxyribonuclease VII large subunit [Clostridium aestuarii]